MQLTLTVCTLGLGLASEVVQGLLPVGPSHIHTSMPEQVRLGMSDRGKGHVAAYDRKLTAHSRSSATSTTMTS